MNTDGHNRFSLDWDLTRWQQPIVFNLELMKLVTHHKREHDFVKMLHTYDFERYSKIIIRKDYEDDDYPTEIFNNSKTEAGGLVFSGGEYVPLNIEIEKLAADTSIYSQMSRYYNSNVTDKQRFKTLLNTNHFRISLDEKNIWSDWEKQLLFVNLSTIQNFIIHDRDIVKIKGALEALVNLQNSANPMGGRLGFKYPIHIYTDNELLEWSKLRRLKLFSTFYLWNLMKDVTINKIIQKETLQLIYQLPWAEINSEVLETIYKQAVFLGDNNAQLLLNIVGESPKNQIEQQLIVLLNQYFSYLRIPSNQQPLTLFTFSKYYSNWLKVDLRKIFEHIRIKYPGLFKLSYECAQAHIIEGKLESRYIWKPTGGTMYDRNRNS